MMRMRPRAQARRDEPSVADVAESLSGVLICGLKRALRNEPVVKSAKTRLEAMGLIKKCPNRFSKLTPLGLDVLRHAKAMETRQGQDRNELDAKHDSAARQGLPETTLTTLPKDRR